MTDQPRVTVRRCTGDGVATLIPEIAALRIEVFRAWPYLYEGDAAYEAASGLPVDRVRIRYYRIYNRYLVCVLTLAASARASLMAGTHQDVVTNFVAMLGYIALADLRETYLEATR